MSDGLAACDNVITAHFIHQLFDHNSIYYPAVVLLVSSRVIVPLALLLLYESWEFIHLQLRFEVYFRALDSIMT